MRERAVQTWGVRISWIQCQIAHSFSFFIFMKKLYFFYPVAEWTWLMFHSVYSWLHIFLIALSYFQQMPLLSTPPATWKLAVLEAGSTSSQCVWGDRKEHKEWVEVGIWPQFSDLLKRTWYVSIAFPSRKVHWICG